MVASKLATLNNGQKTQDEAAQNCAAQDDAAKQLNVSRRSVQTAKIVQEHGSDSAKKAVEQGAYHDWMQWRHWRLDLCRTHDS